MVYSSEMTLDELADKGLLGEMFDEFVNNFSAVNAVSGGVDIQQLVDKYLSKLPTPLR